MNHISFFIPKDAYFLRNSLNSIADLSEKSFFYHLTARISAFAIPLFSLFNVLNYAAHGKLKGALQLTAFTVMSTGWAVLGLFAGSKILTLWRQIVTKPQIPERELQEIRKINQRLLGDLVRAEHAIPPLEGRIRDLTAEKIADREVFDREIAELREQNRIQREQLAAQQQAIQEKDALLAQQAEQANQIQVQHQIVVQHLNDQIVQRDANVATLQLEIRAISQEKAILDRQMRGLVATNNEQLQELENKRALIAQKEQSIIALKSDLEKLGLEKETAIATLQEQVGHNEELNRGLREQVNGLTGRVQDLNIDLRRQADELADEREENGFLRQRIQALTLQSAQAKDDFEKMLQAFNESDKRIDTLFQLNPEKAAECIESLDQEIFHLRGEMEQKEKDKQTVLDEALEWSVVGADLNQSMDAIPAPAHNFAAFNSLHKQLMDGEFGPVINKNQVLAFCPGRKGEPRDSFTTSVLSYLLLKGYQKFQRPPVEGLDSFTLDDFKGLLAKIENIYKTTTVESETLENISLKQNIDLCRSVLEIPPGELKLDQDETITSIFGLLFHQKPWPKEILRMPFFEKKQVVDKLKTVFGEAAVNEVLNYYKLSEGSWSEKEVLALFVGLSANLTLETAEKIFETKDEDQLIQKIMQMRDLVHHFADNNKIVPNVEWDQQYKKDLESLRVMNLVAHAADEDVLDQYPLGKEQLRVAALEHLGRDLPYCFFDTAFSNWDPYGPGLSKVTDGTLVVLSGIQGKPLLYQARIIIRDSGIYGLTLVPVNPKKAKEAFFLWRGTFDGGSVRRDANPLEKASYELAIGGPGGVTFSQRSAEILKKVSEHLEPISEIEHLTFIGHSLGGSDATRHLTLLLKDKKELLQRAKKIDLITLNAPHIEGPTKQIFLQGIKAVPECQFSVTHLEGKNDAVSSFGTCRVAHCHEEKPKNLETQTIVFEQKNAQFAIQFFDLFSFVARGYNRHTTPWLTRGADPTVSDTYTEAFKDFIERQNQNFGTAALDGAA